MASLTQNMIFFGIPVAVARRSRKNLSLRVRSTGEVTLSVTPSTTDGEIRQFMERHRQWLTDRYSPRPAGEPDSREAPLWGRLLPLERIPGRPRGIFAEPDRIVLRSDAELTPEEQTAYLKSLCRSQTAAALPPLLEKWQPVLGVRASRWDLRDMKSRWGSCTPRTGRLCFNIRLAEKAPQCLEYVVVHELCHLLAPDHSPAFWAHVASCLPDWKERRRLTNQPVTRKCGP